MGITVPGYRQVKVRTTAGPNVSRKKFIAGVDAQLKLLASPRAKGRRWFSETPEGKIATDVRYGTVSLLGKGRAYSIKDKVGLKKFYEALKKQCDAGDFDSAIKAARTKIGNRLKGRTIKGVTKNAPKKAAAAKRRPPSKRRKIKGVTKEASTSVGNG